MLSVKTCPSSVLVVKPAVIVLVDQVLPVVSDIHIASQACQNVILMACPLIEVALIVIKWWWHV